MKHFYLLCLCVLLYVTASAQTGAIKGVLQDTAEFKTVAYSTVMVLNAADSSIIRFTHTKDNGSFLLERLPEGKMRLLVSRPGFADYEDHISLAEGEHKDMGAINMLSKTNLLREVIIRDRLEAIRIKGDTTEFLVDSFLTNKNASVEDLMKRLPGIQVDKDGKITAHGKEVQKVLVDGEEFFGDDPTIATRNIKATQVESVQVFDKKSEQATITGVDDGIKEKTINLKLKEDAKKGYFGKLAAGVGTGQRYEHDAMFNKFNRKQKISAYGAASNTNKTGLSWDDSQKYGGEGDQNFFTDDDGNSYMYYNNNDGFDGVGIPQTWYAGAHYSDKKNNDKHAFSFNGSHKEMNVDGFDSNYTKYILPDTFYFNNQKNEINNFKRKNSISANYTLAYDSFTTIKLKLNGTQGDYRRRSIYRSENRNEENSLVNSNNRTNNEDGQSEGIDGSLNYIRKFRKQNRSLSLGATIDYDQQTSDGFLVSTTNFYNPDSGFISNSIDQKKINNTITNHYTLNGTYTEPLSKKFSVITDYSLNVSNDQSTRLTLEKASTPEYDTRLDSLSNDFRYDVLVNRGGLTLKYQYKKITTSAGGRISYTDLEQNNLVNNQMHTQTFVNYFPSARFNYKIGTASAFDISYNGNTKQPSLQQIQPVIDNTNP
ncbi:MAG: outer membrane beta-barrel protein, partial [Bacteroidota bacterium]